MKKRLVSMILSAVLFATSVPVAAFAEDANTQNPVMHSEEGTSQGSNARKESGIDYKKNGGTFAEGYTAPSNYDEPVIRERSRSQKQDMNLPAGMIMSSLTESRLLHLALRIIPAVLSSMQSGRNAITMWIFHRRSMRMGISLR